jgi:hypothetical protein
MELAVTNWTELMAALCTVGRAQAGLFAELAAADDGTRRAFDRVGRDLAGHAALAYPEIRRGTRGPRQSARSRTMTGICRLVFRS